MPTTFVTVAEAFTPAHIALAVGIVALIAVAVAGCYATRVGLRVWKTARVAEALATTHLDAFDARVTNAIDSLEPINAHTAELTDSLQSLREAVAGMQVLVTSIPNERARFRRRVLDVLFPTDDLSGERPARAGRAATQSGTSSDAGVR